MSGREVTEQCSRCGRPEAPDCCAEPPRRKPEVTAADLTDEEIAGRANALMLEDRDLTVHEQNFVRDCQIALGETSAKAETMREARARIAAAINARRRG